jgi:hypothetical protein
MIVRHEFHAENFLAKARLHEDHAQAFMRPVEGLRHAFRFLHQDMLGS